MQCRFPAGPLLRDIRELDDDHVRIDHARRVSTARVVFVNHDVLQHDFPWLAGDESSREAWLLEHAGIISTTQAKQTATNTRIRVTGPVREVWRPANYGRACVVPTRAGLLDVKGTGVEHGAVPALLPHSSGLCTLGEVLREVLFQSLVDELFRRAAPWFWTLPVYGVIDLGFDARLRDGGRAPAGILVRRSHQRPANGIQLPWKSSVQERTQVAIELLLRNYGLTSANRGTRFRFEKRNGKLKVAYSSEPVTDLSDGDRKEISGWLRDATLPLECDGINIQMTRGATSRGRVRAQLLDFDNFEVRSAFREPLVSLVCDQLIRWSVAIWPDEEGFVQPAPSLCLSESKWAFGQRRGPRPRRAEGEGPFMLAHDLARRFRSGAMTGGEVRDRMDDFVSGSVAHW